MELTLQVLNMETRQAKKPKTKAVVGSREKKPQVDKNGQNKCIQTKNGQGGAFKLRMDRTSAFTTVLSRTGDDIHTIQS